MSFISFEELSLDTVLYDIYDYQIVTLKFIAYLDNNYAIFVSQEYNKPVTVYRHRMSALYIDKYDALNALKDILQSKIDEINFQLMTS
jgi:hypothetical protein